MARTSTCATVLRLFSFVTAVILVTPGAVDAAGIWSGNTDGTWSGANWDASPSASDPLVFSDANLTGALATITNNNSFLANVASLTFNGVSYAINGSAFTLNGTINTTGNATLGANVTLAIGGGSLVGAPGSQLMFNGTFDAGSQGLNLSGGGNTTFSNAISNATTLTNSSSGTLTLAGTNSFFTVSTSAGVITGGTLALSGGANALASTATSSLGSNITFVANAATITSSAGNLTLSGTVNAGSLALTFAGAGNTTLGNAITNGTTLTKNGAGTLILANANSYSGATTISGGVLRASDGVGLPTGSLLTLNGGIFETSSNLARSGGSLAGNLQITGGVSGFSANGGAVQVAFGSLGSPTALTWGTAPFQPTTLVLNAATANNTLELKNSISLGNAARTVEVDANVATISGTVSSTGVSGGITKTGLATLVLAIATYTGPTIVSAGTLKVNAGASSTMGNLTLGNNVGGRATFNYDNGSSVGSTPLSMGAFAYGGFGDQTVQLTRTAQQTTSLTFASMPSGNIGSEVNFVIAGTPGVNGTDSKIIFTGQAAGFLSGTTKDYRFFNGGDFVWYDAGGFVRGINYGVDAGTATTAGAAFIGGTGVHQAVTGTIASQPGVTLKTLKLSGASDITVSSGTLTVNSGADTGAAVLKTGGGTATIFGSFSLSIQGAGCIRTDTAADVLVINSGIASTGSKMRLVKSGEGTLILRGASSWGGGVSGGISEDFVNAGTLELAGTYNGGNNLHIASGATFKYSGSTTQSILRGIDGAGNFTVSGSGVMALSAANSYTGVTTVAAGTLKYVGASGGDSGASTYVLSGGTLLLDNTTVAGGNNNARIADASTFTLAGGTFLYQGADASATNSTETVGALSGAGGSTITVSYAASNLATLTAASFSHATGNGTHLVNGFSLGKDSTGTASEGRFLITTLPALIGTTDGSTSGINAAASDTKIVPFLVGEATATSGGTGTATGTPNTFVTYVAGSGLRPLNPTDEFTNNALVAGKNTYLTGGTSATTSMAINSLVINGGNVSINDGVTLTNASGALLFVTSGNISPAGASGVYTGGAENQITTALAASAAISAIIAGGSPLTKSGGGSLTLSGVNTYTGATSVSAGVLKAGIATVPNVSGAFGVNSAVSLANTPGAALDITGFNTQIGSLTGGGAAGGNVTLGAATLRVGGDNTSPAPYAGVISGTGGALNKVGTGTLTLSGTNTYSGLTTITGGTLALSTAATNNIANSTKIIVGDTPANSAATLDVTGVNASGNGFHVLSGKTLAGHGNVLGKVTVDNGGILSPGNSPGTLTGGTTGTLTLSTGALLNYAFDGTQPGISNASPGVSSRFAITSNAAGALVFPTPGNSVTLDINGALPSFSGSAYYELFSYANGGINTVLNFTDHLNFSYATQGSGNTIQLGTTFSGLSTSYTYSMVNDPFLKGIFLDITGIVPSTPGSGTWKNGTGDNVWTTNTDVNKNWAIHIPLAADDVATFDDTVTGGLPGLVKFVASGSGSGNRTVGSVLLQSNSLGYSLGSSSSDTLTLQVTNGTASLAASLGAGGASHQINAKVVTASNATISVAGDSSLSLLGGLDNSAGNNVALNQSDAGSLLVAAVTNTRPGVATVTGVVGVTGNVSGTGTTTVSSTGNLSANDVNQGTFNVHGTAAVNTVSGTGTTNVGTTSGDNSSLTLNTNIASTASIQQSALHIGFAPTTASPTPGSGLVTIAATSPSGYVSPGDTTVPSGSTSGTAILNSLSIANDGSGTAASVGAGNGSTASVYYGKLDLMNNNLVIDYTGTTAPVSSIVDNVRGAIQSAFGTGNWSGLGLTSSMAATPPSGRYYALALMNNNDAAHNHFPSFNSFEGTPVSLTSILVKFTWQDDMNLDGTVDGNDASLFAQQYDNGATTGHTFATGDLNYDGIVDGNDASIFAQHYVNFEPAFKLANLPEPSSFVLAGLGLVGLLAMRRKKHRVA